jgi:hypothetical protein
MCGGVGHLQQYVMVIITGVLQETCFQNAIRGFNQILISMKCAVLICSDSINYQSI